LSDDRALRVSSKLTKNGHSTFPLTTFPLTTFPLTTFPLTTFLFFFLFGKREREKKGNSSNKEEKTTAFAGSACVTDRWQLVNDIGKGNRLQTRPEGLDMRSNMIAQLLGETPSERPTTTIADQTLIDVLRRMGGSVTPRELMHAYRRYRPTSVARAALERLLQLGVGGWRKRISRGKVTWEFTLNH
jgi:hypothetical protein